MTVDEANSPSLRRHWMVEFAIAAVLTIGPTLAVFHGLVLHPGDTLAGAHNRGRNDVTVQYGAFRSLPRESFDRDGVPGFWNPHGLGGMPWWGEPQSAMFYPANWLYFVLPALTAMGWVTVAHHWWAGIGACLLGRKYGLGWCATTVTGVAFLGAPYLLAQTAEGHYNQICLIAWAPWGLLSYERFRRGQRGGIVGTAAVLAFAFFCGHAQEVFFLTLILSTFVAVDVCRTILRPGEAMRLTFGWCLVGGLTIALVAVELLPIWATTKHTVRSGGLSAETAGEISMGPANLWQLVDPFVLGDAGDYAGPGRFYWETLGHFGLVASLLALLGALATLHRHPTGRMLGLFVVGYVFAFGTDLPLFGWLHEYVPGVSFFRSPGRGLFFCSLAAAVLAGQGASTLCQWGAHAARERRLDAIWCTLGVALLAMAGTVAFVPPVNRLLSASVPQFDIVSSFVAVTGTVAVLALAFGSTVIRPALGWLLAIGCVVNSAMLANTMLATIPASSIRVENPVLRHLGNGPERVLAPQDVVSDREAWAAGLHKVEAYQPVPLARPAAVFATTVDPLDPALPMTGFKILPERAYAESLLDLWGVRWWVVAGNAEFERDGWSEVAMGMVPEEFALRGEPVRSARYRVFENESPMPRAFLLGAVRTVEEPQRLPVVLRSMNPRNEVLLETDVLPANAPRAELTPVEIEEYSANRVRLRVEAQAAGYVVLTDTWFPGWRATVDGTPAPVLPAYMAFRAVPVLAGSHVVELKFHPPLATIGVGISVAAWVLALLAAAALISPRQPVETEIRAKKGTEDAKP